MPVAEANTFSLVGRCARTGELGACVASAVPAVGAICLVSRPGVGVASTQSWVNPYLAHDALERMAAGDGARDALSGVLTGDEASAFRQIGLIGADGPGAAHTGDSCTAWCGQRTCTDHAAQGNMLTGPEVIEAMARQFAAASAMPLEERLMRALEAAQSAGGDKRGRQSAALLVASGEAYPRLDLRVDEHPDPIAELRRILGVASAQLVPFIAGMPRRSVPPAPPDDRVVAMLLKPPPQRPGGGGSAEP
ncbi:MAG: DUF1028 domain-containing protein [Pseudomonadota bacterium]